MIRRLSHFMKVVIPRALVLAVLLTCATSTLSQTTLRDYAGLGCMPIDRDKTSIYISYDDAQSEPASSNKNSESKIWLRLHNNLTCGIRIPSASEIEVTLPSGEKTVELLPDKARVAVIYQIQDNKRKSVAKAAAEFSGLHVIGWPILSPGRSVSFGVPIDYFKRKFDVAVVFVYTWEGFSSQSLMHQVYFLHDELPATAQK